MKTIKHLETGTHSAFRLKNILHRLIIHPPTVVDIEATPAELRQHGHQYFQGKNLALQKQVIVSEVVFKAQFCLLEKVRPASSPLDSETITTDEPNAIWRLVKFAASFDASSCGNSRERTSWLFLKIMTLGVPDRIELFSCDDGQRWVIQITPKKGSALICDTVLNPEVLLPKEQYLLAFPEPWKAQTPFSTAQASRASWQVVIAMAYQVSESFQRILDAQIKMLLSNKSGRSMSELDYLAKEVEKKRVRSDPASISESLTDYLHVMRAAYQLYAQVMPITREIKQQMWQEMKRQNAGTQLTQYGRFVYDYWQSQEPNEEALPAWHRLNSDGANSDHRQIEKLTQQMGM